MTDDIRTYSSYAIMRELSSRELHRKLALFPDDMRHLVLLASGIVGAEIAKRVEETPQSIQKDGEGFAAGLLELIDTTNNDSFKNVLMTVLVETMKDELRFSCANCSNFNRCIDLENLSVGSLFMRSALGDESAELKKEISRQVNSALRKTPYIDAENAEKLCPDFLHQYSASTLGGVFNRYADIASSLQQRFGIDYRGFQEAMININMEFYAKSGS